MAMKILIKRRVPLEKAWETIALFRQMHILATSQEGYIGLTGKNGERLPFDIAPLLGYNVSAIDNVQFLSMWT